MKKLLIVLICLLLTGCGIVPEIPEPEVNKTEYRAFFVGVGRYENGATLPSPESNVEKLAYLFLDCKFGEEETKFCIMKQMTNFDATKKNILNGIDLAFAEADEDDVSYFYYMGHGGKKEGVPIITPTDYDYSLETAITVHELEERLSMIPGTKIVFIESCHSGNFIDKNGKGLERFDEYSLDLLNKENYQVLTSSRGSQYSWDNWDGSYFCKYLIKGCKNLVANTNGDKIVDLSELYEYIRINVTKQTVQIYPEKSTFPIVEFGE